MAEADRLTPSGISGPESGVEIVRQADRDWMDGGAHSGNGSLSRVTDQSGSILTAAEALSRSGREEMRNCARRPSVGSYNQSEWLFLSVPDRKGRVFQD